MDFRSLISLYNSILSDVQPQEKLQQNIELLTMDKALEQDKDVLLLKLSTLHQLYTLNVGSELDLKDWRKELCHLLLKPSHSLQEADITSDLVILLYNSESFVCYATYKSLLFILVSPLCCSEIFDYTVKKLMTQLVSEQFHLLQHAQLYGLQLITELLKNLRKMTFQNTSALDDKERKKSLCVSFLLSFWPKLLKSISTSSKLSMKSDINQILLQFLLLTLELLRHSDQISVILPVLVPALGHIADVVHDCSSCLLCLTRMCDLFRKCLKYPLPQTTFYCLTRKEFLHTIISSLTKWFQRESGSCYLCMISLETNCSFPSIEDMTSPKTLEDGINDTFVRKSLLLSLLLAEGHIKQWIPLSAIIHSLKELTSQIPSTLPCKFIMQQLIIHLVSEQDSCLVDVLKSCLQLTKPKCELSRSENDEEILSALEINGLMIEFLFSISFDYSTILDFIINVETDFDCFFEEYLSFLSEETIMKELFHLCKERDVIERARIDRDCTTLEEEDIKDCQLSSIQLEVSYKQEKDSHCSPVIQSKRQDSEALVCLVAYSSSESESEDQDSNIASMIDHSAMNIFNRIMALFEQLHYSLSKLTADIQLMVVESKLVRIVKIIKFINKIGSTSNLYQ